MTVGAEVAEKIWVPDTFFANEKSAYFHTATTPNTFLRISHNGDVLRSIRFVLLLICRLTVRSRAICFRSPETMVPGLSR